MTTPELIYEHTHGGTGAVYCTCGWIITWDRPDQQATSEAQATQHAHLHTTPKGETLDL